MIIMKNDYALNRKVIFVITLLMVLIGITKNEIFARPVKTTDTSDIIAMAENNEYNLEEDVISFINENEELFSFYSKTFGITIDNIKESIINANNGNTLNRSDIGNTKKTYDNLDKNIIDYLFNLRKTNKKLFNQDYTNANEYSKKYIYGLINYFAGIYGDVDYDTLAAIAYIESGDLNSKYMLKCNNIYGGMSSKGLIKYSNIEFGVLSYVNMMSKGYYGKGLTTVETIARKYNSGSTTWVGKVNKIKNKFINAETIDFNTLINLK